MEDSGPGIDQENFDNIFNPFYTTKRHGMGLGLSICRSIVEAHGGKLMPAVLPALPETQSYVADILGLLHGAGDPSGDGVGGLEVRLVR